MTKEGTERNYGETSIKKGKLGSKVQLVDDDIGESLELHWITMRGM